VATPVENSTGIDHHARRVNFSRDHALRFDLYAALRENHAVKAPGNHHAIAFDLSLDLSAFSQNNRLLGDDVALHISINAKRSLELECAFQRYALIDKSGPLFAAAIL
jgi:hypothetical protein